MESIQNFTNTVHENIMTAQESIEILVYAIIAAVVLCIVSYVFRLIGCIRWCFCPKSSGYNNL